MDSIRVNHANLLRALRNIAPAVENKGKEAYAQAVRLDFHGSKLTLAVYGSKLQIKTDVSVTKKGDDFSFALPHAALLKVVSMFKDVIEITLLEGKLRFASGKRTFTLEKVDVVFPDYIEDERFVKILGVDAEEFANGLGVTARAASTDEMRGYLHCVALDFSASNGFLMVATDAYRLAALEIQGEVTEAAPSLVRLALGGAKAISKAILAENRKGNVYADTGLENKQESEEVETYEVNLYHFQDGLEEKTRITFAGVSWTISSPDGAFPAWKKMLPESGQKLKLDGEEMADALKALEAIWKKPSSLAAPNVATPTRLIANKEKAMLFYREPGLGGFSQELVEARYYGDDKIEIGFNPSYLKDMAWVLGKGDVVKDIEALVPSGEGAILFESEGNRYLLMPIRL